MGKRLSIIAAVVILIFGYSVYQALKLDEKLSESQSFYQSNSVLKEIPEVTFPIFKSNEKVNLKKLAAEGNYIVVHFWATWCGPCLDEFPTLVQLTEKMKDSNSIKFLFVAVNDKASDIEKFLKKSNADLESNYLIVIDSEYSHQKLFGTYKLPETYLFGKNGQLIKKFIGPQQWMDDKYHTYLTNL